MEYAQILTYIAEAWTMLHRHKTKIKTYNYKHHS